MRTKQKKKQGKCTNNNVCEGQSPELVLDFRAEVSLMKSVHHPNILSLIGAQTTPSLRLISEFCEKGNLFDLLYNDYVLNPKESVKLNWALRLRMALGEARGMDFLHSAFPVPLIHRDLKSLNLLLSKNYAIKISDFGLSRFRDTVNRTEKGVVGCVIGCKKKKTFLLIVVNK